MKNWKTTGLIATAVIVLLIPLAGIKYQHSKLLETDNTELKFVGASTCIECHEQEHELWLQSHHYLAMAHATDSTVLGDFDNVEVTLNGTTHKFYKQDGKFYTYTKGVDGKMAEYLISHTFGYTPLQQYLVPFERGKFQCLPIAWDTENKRWFDMAAMVYSDLDLDPGNWLYWTNQAQNWNGMCAECHSTNLKKNYNYQLDSFNTTYSEINVSCEACHGPSSQHLAWAKLPESKQLESNNYGLVAKTSGISNVDYVNLCARCHTRRMQIGDYDHTAHKDLLDIMSPALLQDNYHADGQILDEDYVWGSFTQSKMYHNDIKCSDCHDVHSTKRHLEGNALCFTCHQPDYYGTAKHHFHKNAGESNKPYYIDGKEVAIGEGASCVNCHMPAQYFMGIDFRNDHSIRIPRPDLTKEIGVPNACNQCHTDKTADWAIKYTEQWYGKKERPHYGTTIAKARNNDPEALNELIRISNDELMPLIVRATCLSYLQNYPSDTAFSTIQKMLGSSESMLRLAAIRIYQNPDVNGYISDLKPLLRDPVKAVRMQAGLMFSYLPNQYITADIAEKYKGAVEEFRKQNEYMADFPGGRANLGLLANNLGDYNSSVYHYKKAVEIDSAFIPGLINLAMGYNRIGQNSNAEAVYKNIIKQNPDLPGVYYSLGLLLAEQNKYTEAIEYLLEATKKDPANSRINYNLGLIYQQVNDIKNAEKQLRHAVAKDELGLDYRYALAHLYVSTQQLDKAEKEILILKDHFPNNNDVAQLYNYILSLRTNSN